MNSRYIFNTSGDYVAFVSGGNIFSKNLEWLGVVANGNEVYNTDGIYVGYILDDDRIVRNRNETTLKRIVRPRRPIRPIRPISPLRRLRKIKLPAPFEDIFEPGNDNKLIPTKNLPTFEHLLDHDIIAHNGTYLGRINVNKYDSNSLSNPYGYGNKYRSDSIFNRYGPYGGAYSPHSPFNAYSQTPPKIIKNQKLVGYLTKNGYKSNAVDPEELISWLARVS